MKRVLVFAAALMIAVSAFAQQMPPIPVDPAVRIGKLDNGLTYYIRHNEEPKGQANFYIAQKVGSILEEESQRGLAHFLEHMCFNGTQNFPGNGVIKYCESIGVKFGADLNAYTSIDETVYNIDNVPVGKVPSAVDSCLWILHDWADGLLLTDEDIDHERGVIHEEWRTRSNAMMRMYEAILPVIYPGNRYGERMPIGLMSVVDNFPYKDLRDYYEKWYRPDQQGIVVVGDIDVDAIEAKIKDIFSTIATPVDPAERTYFQIEDNSEPIISLAKDKEQPYAVSFIFFKHDAYPDAMKGDLNYYIYQYALGAMSNMINARLNELAQNPEPPFVQAVVADDDFFIAKTKKALMGQVVTNEQDYVKGLTSLYREMLRMTRGGFTASEYERARAEIATMIESQYNQRDKIKSASFCKEYVRHFIDNEPIPGIENEFALFQQLAPNIPVEAINAIVKQIANEGNLVVASMLPDKEGVTYPAEEEVAKLLADVSAEDIKPYEDKVIDEPLVSELPAAAKIVSKESAQLGYDKYTLANGIEFFVKKTDFNADQILMSATSKGGTSIYPTTDALSIKVLTEVMSIGGLGNFSKTDLQKVLAGKKANVSAIVSMFTDYVGGSTTPKDFETMLQLVYLTFTAQRSDAEAFESWKTRTRAVLQNAEADPMTAFQDSVATTVYTDSKRFGGIKAAQVDQVDYDHIVAMGRERFSNAADFQFIFTGNIDESTAIPLIEKYLGALPTDSSREECNPDALDFTKGNVVNLFDKPMEIPMVTNLFLFSGKTEYSLKNDIAFDIASQSLTTKLLEEIREKEGGTYGIQAVGELASFPKQEIYMQIAYQTNPERYEYLNNRVHEILNEFAANGPDQENIDKVKEYLLKKYKENLRENQYWSSSLSQYLLNGVDTMTDYEAVLNSVTVDDVKGIVKAMLDQNNESTVIMHGVSAQ